MNDQNLVRPDPLALLSAIKKRQKQKEGRLYLFLGMSPGVGKTYAMLQAAHSAIKNGKDLVAGVVETHGRIETEELLKGLPTIPKKSIEHRGITFHEMDIDAILKRKPSVVLVDELAHSNVVGSRHAKRWQDVEELLDNGIDVYSTLNVQHLESRKKAVEQIIKIGVSETVPDSVIDKAFQIQLIDLSVPDLLKRLREGKVYLGDRKEAAANNFFREEKLTALREIALRLTAEKVDSELKSFITEREAGSTWNAVERLLIAIDDKKEAENLIRAARKLAFNLECPWFCIHVAGSEPASEKEKSSLLKNLELARKLGAEVLMVTDVSIVDAIIRVAKQNDVTKILVGRSHSTLWRSIFRTSLVHRLLSQTDVDVLVVGNEPKATSLWSKWKLYFAIKSPFVVYAQALLLTVLLSAMNGIIAQFIGYQAIGVFFLAGILCLGLFFPLGPTLWSSVISAVVWDYFFIPPVHSFFIENEADIFICLSYLVAALVTGSLMRRIRSHQAVLLLGEHRSRILHQTIEDMSSLRDPKALVTSVLRRVEDFLGGVADVSLAKRDGAMTNFFLGRLIFANKANELAVAKWSMENNKSAGLYTDTLSSSQATYIPIRGDDLKIGALAFRPAKNKALGNEDFALLFTMAHCLGVSIERDYLRKKADMVDKYAESEALHHLLMEYSLEDAKFEMEQSTPTIQRLIFRLNNYWIMSRLLVGIFPLEESKTTPQQLLEATLARLSFVHNKDIITTQIHESTPSMLVDSLLMSQALATILYNSLSRAREKVCISVEQKQSKNEVKIIISDDGPLLKSEFYSRLFERFVPQVESYPRGLGFHVAKGVIRAHEGRISALSNEEQGLSIEILLPVGDA